MAVAQLYNVPDNQGDWQRWMFDHMVHHRDVNSNILAKFNVALPEYILDPADLKNPAVFLYQHQLMHNNTAAVLVVKGHSIPSFDLTDVDFTDKEQAASWIWLNATLHYAEGDALGVW